MSLRIEVRPLRSGWIEGTIGNCRFQAKVYDAGSKYGINGGRVSKLEVWEEGCGAVKAFIRYDRGWDVKPATHERRKFLRELLEFLEKMPTE